MAKIVESVTLNFTDLTGDKTGCVKLGSNKFWKGFVEDLGGGQANFQCLWGPTGEKGSDKGSKLNISLAEALKILATKAREKENKGYTRLQVRDDAEETAKAAAKGVSLVQGASVPAASTPKFHPDVGRLLGVIYNETSRVVRSGLSSQAGATAENPIGNLSDRQLDIGGEVLDEIGSLLEKTFGREDTSNKSQSLPLMSGVPDTRIIDLTNRYMSNVPREIGRDQRGRENLHRLVISSYERLGAQREFLQLLRDAHLTKAVFAAAAHSTSAAGKEQVWYDGLGCSIDICESGSADFRRVLEIFGTGFSQKNYNWWRNGKLGVKVAKVYKFTRNGSEKAFNAYADKVTRKKNAVGKIMAWHGTRTENLLGISKSGLLMPENLPKGVTISGKAFGKGVYHAPAWSATGTKTVGGLPTDGLNGAGKSLNYTSASGAAYGSGSGRSAFMYLQDVALGVADTRTSACWDKHRPDGWPEKDFIFACATKNQGGFVHDELVTFDQDAQMFRYLVEVEVL